MNFRNTRNIKTTRFIFKAIRFIVKNYDTLCSLWDFILQLRGTA
jgi:hypothetical protein